MEDVMEQDRTRWTPDRRVTGDRLVCAAGTQPEWAAWQAYFAERDNPKPFRKLLDGDAHDPPVLWGAEGLVQPDTVQIVRRLDRLGRKSRPVNGASKSVGKQAARWLADVETESDLVGTAYQAIAWAEAMPLLAAQLDEEIWWDLLHWLVDASEQAQNGRGGELLSTQLLGGELGVVLAYWFPEFPACAQLAKPALRLISDALAEITDGEGVVHGSSFHQQAALLGCWTRARYLAKQIPKRKLRREAVEQFEWFVRQFLRFSRPDGTLVLSPVGKPAADFAPLVRAAVKFSKDEDDSIIADTILPVSKARRRAALKALLPDPSEHSEWSEVAHMQTNWTRETLALTVNYASSRLMLELRAGGRVLLSGEAHPELKINDTELTPTGGWHEICWTSDDDADYLELEIEFEQKWKLQRQIVLVHDDDVVFSADAVLGTKPAKIELATQWPLASRVSMVEARETNEASLKYDGKRIGHVLPIGLPEWRHVTRTGSLSVGGRQVSAAPQACALYAPIFWDLSTERIRKKLTWRLLTVAQDLEICPDHVALGYRVQIGDEQWVIYRSLAPTVNRTVLGHNLGTEFMAGRFDEDGEVEELIEIE